MYESLIISISLVVFKAIEPQESFDVYCIYPLHTSMMVYLYGFNYYQSVPLPTYIQYEFDQQNKNIKPQDFQYIYQNVNSSFFIQRQSDLDDYIQQVKFDTNSLENPQLIQTLEFQVTDPQSHPLAIQCDVV